MPTSPHPLSASKLIQSPRPLVIGHRGFARFVPENTLPSFLMALASGVDLVELDYRHSQDGVPVVIHDPHLKRTTDAVKKWKRRACTVASRPVAELQQLDAGQWFDPGFIGTRIPLLREALELILSRAIPLIERKSGDAQTCVNLFRQMGVVKQVVLQSFDWEFLRQVNALEPGVLLGALGPPAILPGGKRPLGFGWKLNTRWLRRATQTGASVVVWSDKVSRRSINAAHERGLRVWVYTVNKSRAANRLLSFGVDGLISDNPTLIWRAIALRQKPAFIT